MALKFEEPFRSMEKVNFRNTVFQGRLREVLEEGGLEETEVSFFVSQKSP